MEINHYLKFFPGILAVAFLLLFIIKKVFRKKLLLQKKPYLLPVPLLLIAILLLISYRIVKAVQSEYYFRKSLKTKLVKEIYDYQRLAIITNPNIDIYRVQFSRTNLMLANSLLAKSKELSDQDKQIATQAIKAAIEEAKAAVKLNDHKAANWAHLADVYRNLLKVAQNADVWSISAFQRAIILDPQNANYRLDLGGVYYLVKDYDQALRQLEQAIALKPDWPNAYYNLAWVYYQKKDYQKAVEQMNKVITLLDKNKDASDYQKAQKELEEFKLKLLEEKSS